MDGEQAYQEKRRLVFAVDQMPFEIPGGSGHVNRFCVLQPLMTLDGERLSSDTDTFPNRGRVWWLLRNDIKDELVLPGSLWTGTLERASKWDATRHDTDKFQVNIRSIQPGGTELVEILPVAEDHPDLVWVQRQVGISWPRPVASIIMLQGRKSLLGPMQALWYPSERRLKLSALSAGKAEVLRVPTEEFKKVVRVERFHLNLTEYDTNSLIQTLTVSVAKVPWLQLEQLRRVGEVLDASTDAQILNWATRYQKITTGQATQLKKVLADIAQEDPPLTDEADVRKLARLKQITADATRVLDLGEEVARELSSGPAFTELVSRHAEALVAQRVEKEIEKRRGQIEAEVQFQKRQLEQVQKDVENLTAEYEHKAAEKEKELDSLFEAREKKLETREKTVQELEAKQAGLRQMLEELTREYQEAGEKVTRNLLATLPLLRHVAPANGSAEPFTPARPFAPSEAPAFVPHVRSRPAGPAPDEAEFVEQFARVAEQHGFLFARDDLINFHVCVKTGGLTLLAGLSGTGKSSLPRLYAEALGGADEYLHVPVRPDWLDDRDLVGAFNAVAQRFEPASSGLVEHLIAAALDGQHDRGGLYLVCLDEMNLARVEHYFAQFLSVLELPAASRCVTLFAPGLVRPGDPYHDWQRVPLGDNVRFLGTVNVDETTHFFSPKVLDRSQVVAFSAPDLAAPRRARKATTVHGIKPVPLATFLGWCRKAADDGPGRQVLLQVNEVLRRSRLGLGFRQYDRLLSYVASARPFFTEDKALDLQLMQVVMPRLRPTAPGFPETLPALRQAIPADRFPRTAEHLARLVEARAEDDFFQLL